MTERLDQIEAILERTAQRSQANVVIEADRSAIAQLRSTVNSLVEVVKFHQRNHEATQGILEHLLGRQ